MTNTFTVDPSLDGIVAAILDCADPDLILLGGSRAWGTPRTDSDYDLTLVLPDGAVRGAAEVAAVAAVAARNSLRNRGICADVIALTAGEYAQQQHDPGLAAFRVAREGRLLYTRGTIPQRTPRSPGVRELPREGLDAWIRRAESDLRAAEALLESEDPARDAICFHSHSAVEKLLKATIVRGGNYPPRTHDLVVLLRLQPPAVREIAGVADACALLMSLPPRSRYPDLPEPTPDETRLAIDAARLVRRVLLPPRLPLKSKRPEQCHPERVDNTTRSVNLCLGPHGFERVTRHRRDLSDADEHE